KILSPLVPTVAPIPPAASAGSTSANRPTAGQLYRAYEDTVYRRTDQFFFILLPLQWVVGILFAAIISPRAWSGASSSIHPHLYAAIFLGGAFCAFPMILIWRLPGQ